MTCDQTQQGIYPCLEKRDYSQYPLVKQGLRVRTGLQAGAWRCTSCSGQAVGDQLFKPQCSYCEGY